MLEPSADPQKYFDLGIGGFLVTGGGDEAEKKLTCRKTEAEDDLQESLPRPAVLLDGVVHGRIDAR